MQKRVTSILLVVCMWIASPAAARTNAPIPGTGTLQMDDAAWKRLQRLDPGSRLKITVGNTAAVERYLVQLNESELIVLNLTAKKLPRRQLLQMAADNPAWVAGTSKTMYKDNNLRIGPDGVFVKDQKIAELAEVVEHIPRGQISSVAKANFVCAVGDGTTICLGHRFDTTGNASARLSV